MNNVFVTDANVSNYMLNIKPNVVFKNGSIEYTFMPLYAWDLDRISWNINDQWEKSQTLTENFKVTIKENGKYVVTAKWYKNWELKAVAMFTMLQNDSPKFLNMTINPWKLWEETSIVSNLVWLSKNDISNISINRWDITTNSTDLSQKHKYDEAWLKTIQYNVLLNDWTVLYNVVTISIQNPLLSQSYAVNIVWDRLWYNQNEKLALWLSMYPKTSVMSLFTSYQVWQKTFLYNPDLTKTLLNFSYSTAWDKLLTNSVAVNRCVALVNQWTVHINSMDVCENAIKNSTLSNYKCDLDWDKIPDICDDDIDGDGVKNLVGLLLYENKDCSIWENNVNSNILKKWLWVCSLDNCPFTSNSDQSDLNNNWIWEVCENSLSSLLYTSLSNNEWSTTLTLDEDQDGDGVSDGVDACVTVPWNSSNGCPENYTQNCWVYSSCGNGKLDEGEDCHSCPQDAWVCCGNGVLDYGESCQTCPVDAGDCKLCWNGKIDEWETCKNCEEDVWKCTARCGNGIVEDAEDCRNCPKDVKECSAICWNGEVEEWEDCENCKKDVKICIKNTCWDEKVDIGAWEECDSGDRNGKDGKCTKMCTKYDDKNPKCWNGEIDEWEDCEICAVDLWEKCVKDGDLAWDNKLCWNGKIDEWEDCDPNDLTKKNRWKYGCSNSCKQLLSDNVLCNPDYDGEILLSLFGSDILCLRWSFSKFNFNAINLKRTRFCVSWSQSLECVATKTTCGDWIIGNWEDCETCPKDVKDSCIDDWEKKCWNGKIDEWEDCETCPKDIKDSCIDDWEKKCWNGKIDEWEDCETCPKDVWECEPNVPTPDDSWWNIQNDNCNICPCEYVDYSTDLIKWDFVRAKLRDKSLSVFYRYSNSVSLENFLDVGL